MPRRSRLWATSRPSRPFAGGHSSLRCRRDASSARGTSAGLTHRSPLFHSGRWGAAGGWGMQTRCDIRFGAHATVTRYHAGGGPASLHRAAHIIRPGDSTTGHATGCQHLASIMGACRRLLLITTSNQSDCGTCCQFAAMGSWGGDHRPYARRRDERIDCNAPIRLVLDVGAISRALITPTPHNPYLALIVTRASLCLAFQSDAGGASSASASASLGKSTRLKSAGEITCASKPRSKLIRASIIGSTHTMVSSDP